jgi:hypothetical protein
MTSPKGNESPIRQGFQQYGGEDTLDRFQKEQLNKQYSNAYNNPSQNIYSPTYFPTTMQGQGRTYSNSPNKRGPQSQEMFLDNLKPEYGQNFARDVRLDASPNQKQREMKFNFSTLQDIESDFNPSEPYQYNNNRNSMPQVKKSTYEDISYESPSRVKGFERKVDTYSPTKSFNLISNQSISQNEMQERSPYGRSIGALLVGQESIAKSGYDSRTMSPTQKQRELKRSDSIKKQFESEKAGKQSFYGETDYRYTHKLPEQEQGQNDQLYGPKALKNLSTFKLY